VYRARGVGSSILSFKSSHGPTEDGLMKSTLGSCDRTGANTATSPLADSPDAVRECATCAEPKSSPGIIVTVSPGYSENEGPPSTVKV
jgi:hypothetical protein